MLRSYSSAILAIFSAILSQLTTLPYSACRSRSLTLNTVKRAPPLCNEKFEELILFLLCSVEQETYWCQRFQNQNGSLKIRSF